MRKLTATLLVLLAFAAASARPAWAVQSVAVVRGTLSATGGTTDLTSAGLGTVDAAIIFCSNANTTNNPQAHASMSVGFWDGTNQRTIGAFSLDGSGTSDEGRVSGDDRALKFTTTNTAAANLNEYTASAITDGVRLTQTVDNTNVERYVTAVLLSGVDAAAGTFTPNSTQDAAQESASLGFSPESLFFLCIGNDTVDQDQVAHSIFSFGAATPTAHRMTAIGHEDAVGTTDCTLLYSETRCVGQVFDGALSWAGEVTTFGADSFTMTTRDGGSGGDLCFYLALGGDFSGELGTLTTPASTGTDAVSTGVSPDAVLSLMSTASGATLHTDSGAEGVSLGASDGTNDYAHNFTTGDGLATSNSQSAASASAVIDLDDENGGFQNLADATVSAMGSSSFTLNYSAVPVTARKGFYLAFGEAAASGAPGLTTHSPITNSPIFGR